MPPHLIGCWLLPNKTNPFGQFQQYANNPLHAQEAQIMLYGTCKYLHSFGGDNLVRGVEEFTVMVSTNPQSYQNIIEEVWVNTAVAVHLYCATLGISWNDIRQIFFDMTYSFNNNNTWSDIVDDLSQTLGVNHSWAWFFTVAMIDTTRGSSLVFDMNTGAFNNQNLVNGLTTAFNQYMANQNIDIQHDCTLEFEFSHTPSLQLDRVNYRCVASNYATYIVIK
jgi:hypothetical protein